MEDNERATQPLEQDESKQPAVWGRLIAKSSGLANQDLNLPEIIIGRKSTNTIVINDQRLSGVHCVLTRLPNGKVYIEDRSSNGTFVNNTKMSKGAKLQLEHGNEIWLLHQSKVTTQSAMGYQIELQSKIAEMSQIKSMEIELEVKRKQEAIAAELKKKQEEFAAELKKKNEQELKKMEEEKKKITQQSNDLLKSIQEQVTCCVCLEIMYLPVTVHPCNHRFCGYCLTGLIKAKNPNCAQCRKEIKTAQRDSGFNTLIEGYLKNHPEEQRSKEDMELNDKGNMFGYDAINVHEVIHGKKVVPAARVLPARGRRVQPARLVRGVSADLSASQESSDSPPPRCPECRVARNGFQCGAGQLHVNCLTCGKGIASRGATFNQSCLLCGQFFCNMYNPPCSTFGTKLALVRDREADVRIDDNTFRNNAQEFQIFKSYMMEKKINSRSVFTHVVTNQMDTGTFRYIVDRKVMKIPPIASQQVPVTRDTPVCDVCWISLWFQMVLNYRISIAGQLPQIVRRRADCYYGVNCGTMTHRPDHAKKLNHCCYQTRF